MSDLSQPAGPYPGDDAPITERLLWSIRSLVAGRVNTSVFPPDEQVAAILIVLSEAARRGDSREGDQGSARSLMNRLAFERLEQLIAEDPARFQELQAFVLSNLTTSPPQYPAESGEIGATFEGKPINVTDELVAQVGMAKLTEIWTSFVHWRDEVMPGLSEEDRSFTRTFDGRQIYIHEDPDAFTLMFSDKY